MEKTTIACGAIVVVISLMLGCGTTAKRTNDSLEGKLYLEPSEVLALMESAPRFEPFGFTAHNLSTIGNENAAWAKAEIELGRRLQVITVEEGSLADKAGLEKGDVLISINDRHIQKDEDGIDFLRDEIGPHLDHAAPVRFLVIRNGGAIELECSGSSQENVAWSDLP